MQIMWRTEHATVQQVKDALEPDRPLAYTTVMTVLSRLTEKGLLDRRKDGRAYIYSPSSSKDQVAGSLLRALVERLYAGRAGEAIAHLLEAEEAVDEEELKRLEELIEARRRERKK